MNIVISRIIIIIPFLFPLVATAADVMYVNDQLRITLRTGQGNEHRIIKALITGDRLEVLETTDTGYTQVRAEDGTEGWVRTQYLTEEPVAAIKLGAAEKKLASANERLAALKQQVSELQSARSKLESENQAITKKNKSIDKELAHLSKVATRPIQLDKENKRLKEANVNLETNLQLKMQENQVLKDKSDREWFVIGAAVLLGGIILGLIIPKLRPRKRSSW